MERKVVLVRLNCACAALALVSMIAGCSNVTVPPAKSTTGRTPVAAEVPGSDETVRGVDDPPIVTLEMGSRLRERRLHKAEELPSAIIVPTTNLTAVPVTTALQAVLAGTDVSLSWNVGTFEDRLVTVANLSGPLPRVIDRICSSAKVFCAYRKGLLEIKEKETFIIELPVMPVKATSSNSATNSMADMVSELAGEKAKIDQQGGTLVYTTSVEGQERISEYLTQLRNGRPLVVLQLYIWEVALNKDNGTGINWDTFNFGRFGGHFQNVLLGGATSFTNVSSAGTTLNATLKGQIDADAVIKFLSTQGQVQTISNPQLTFVSGSNAEFRVGGKQRYISEVGSLTNSTVSGSSSSSSNNTISTDSLDTGLTVTVNGVYESGIISSVLEVEIQDVVSLNPTTTSGYTIDLPETSERKVSTSLRLRPGDNLVLAGLVTSRDTNSREGLPLPFGKVLSTFSQDELKNTELVMLVKPSVVLFSDSTEDPYQHASQLRRSMAMDKSVDVSTLSPMPLGKPSSDDPSALGAPVDKRFMQRGFSRAFNELLDSGRIESGEGSVQ